MVEAPGVEDSFRAWTAADNKGRQWTIKPMFPRFLPLTTKAQ